MHPTVDEQLRGVRRLLQIVAADDGLSPAATEALADASRILRRLQSSWAQVPAFLASDNRATAAVLTEIAPLLPAELAADAVAMASGCAEPHLADLDLAAVHERNKALRALLAQAVTALPHDDAGARARRVIAAHLCQRLARDPSLGRFSGG